MRVSFIPQKVLVPGFLGYLESADTNHSRHPVQLSPFSAKPDNSEVALFTTDTKLRTRAIRAMHGVTAERLDFGI